MACPSHPKCLFAVHPGPWRGRSEDGQVWLLTHRMRDLSTFDLFAPLTFSLSFFLF